jgi:glucosamine--fructose-6-phosphate aminotransferase (isomerizing)
MSKMRQAMISQPDELARLLAETGPAEEAATRLKGRRLLLVGIGTSWHAAHHGAWMLREAGVEAEPVHAADVAPCGRAISPEEAVIVLSHTGGTGYSMAMLERAREAGAETLHISGVGNGGELETVAAEASYAYTASHTGALARLAQIATALGAQLGPLQEIPERVAAVLDLPGPLIGVPARLVELIGAGPNGWTAQEGALKIREASYVAAEGLSSEQFFHGPSVALDEQDTLVVLDGGGADGRPHGGDRRRGRGHGRERRALPAARARRGPIGVRAHRRRPADRARALRGPRRQPGPLPLRGGRAPRGGVRSARLLADEPPALAGAMADVKQTDREQARDHPTCNSTARRVGRVRRTPRCSFPVTPIVGRPTARRVPSMHSGTATVISRSRGSLLLSCRKRASASLGVRRHLRTNFERVGLASGSRSLLRGQATARRRRRFGADDVQASGTTQGAPAYDRRRTARRRQLWWWICRA